MGNFCPPGSGSTDPIESGSNPNPDPDPQPWIMHSLNDERMNEKLYRVPTFSIVDSSFQYRLFFCMTPCRPSIKCMTFCKFKEADR